MSDLLFADGFDDAIIGMGTRHPDIRAVVYDVINASKHS